MKGRFAVGLGLLVFLAAAASGQERFDMKVRADFFAGFAGNRESLQRGMKACEDVLAANPTHAEALVWHGGGLYFLAAERFRNGDLAKGAEMSSQGLREMDQAIEIAPRSLGTRIPRGAYLLTASRSVPAEIRRAMVEKGVRDYEVGYELQKDHLDTLGQHPRGELLFGLAEGYSRLGQVDKARSFFGMIQRDLPKTEYAERAALWISSGSLPPEKTRCVGCHVQK